MNEVAGFICNIMLDMTGTVHHRYNVLPGV